MKNSKFIRIFYAFTTIIFSVILCIAVGAESRSVSVSKTNESIIYSKECVFPCFDYRDGKITETGTNYSALFTLDSKYNLNVVESVDGEITKTMFTKVSFVYQNVTNDIVVLSRFLNTGKKVISNTYNIREYGNNLDSDFCVLRYYDVDENTTNPKSLAIDYVKGNISQVNVTIPLYSNVFYGAESNPVYVSFTDIPATLNGKSDISITKRMCIYWDGSCEIRYHVNQPLIDGDTIKLSQRIQAYNTSDGNTNKWGYVISNSKDNIYSNTCKTDLNYINIDPTFTYKESNNCLEGNLYDFIIVYSRPESKYSYSNGKVVFGNSIANNVTQIISDNISYTIPIVYYENGRSSVSVSDDVKEYTQDAIVGDIDGDGVVTPNDASIIMNYYSSVLAKNFNGTLVDFAKG